MMNICDLPIITGETLEDKTRVLIYENKLVCHPDLVEKVVDGMTLMRAGAEGFKADIITMEKKNESS